MTTTEEKFGITKETLHKVEDMSEELNTNLEDSKLQKVKRNVKRQKDILSLCAYLNDYCKVPFNLEKVMQLDDESFKNLRLLIQLGISMPLTDTDKEDNENTSHSPSESTQEQHVENNGSGNLSYDSSAQPTYQTTEYPHSNLENA